MAKKCFERTLVHYSIIKQCKGVTETNLSAEFYQEKNCKFLEVHIIERKIRDG